MTGPELLLKLMEDAGETATSLSKKLKNKPPQPQIFKFLTGVSKEPRVSTLKPIADHFKIAINAFHDPELAETEYSRVTGHKPKDGDEDSQLGPLLPAPYLNPNGRVGEKTEHIGTPEELAKLGFDTSVAGGAAQNKAATLAETLDRLGDLLATASPKTRADVAALLASYARDPSDGKRLAQAIAILLTP